MSKRTEVWQAAPECAGVRLDQFLSARLPEESRSQIQIWIRKGYATVNSAPVKTGYRIRPVDRVELCVPGNPPEGPFAEPIPLHILYEDDDLVVINKPAGMVCHTGAGVHSGTLVNALLHRFGPLDAGTPQRPGIVHRLDKLTSGVMLAAKNSLAHRQLSDQFKCRQIQKQYTALVYGSPSPPKGTIDRPIGRDPGNRKRMSSRARHRRSAVTHYSMREDFSYAALLDVQIDTGRTHQIRVHLAEKGHPIVGDILYGGNRMRNLPPELSKATQDLRRPFLHSRQLAFAHPRSGTPLSFTAALPEELERFLALIRCFRAG